MGDEADYEVEHEDEDFWEWLKWNQERLEHFVEKALNKKEKDE